MGLNVKKNMKKTWSRELFRLPPPHTPPPPPSAQHSRTLARCSRNAESDIFSRRLLQAAIGPLSPSNRGPHQRRNVTTSPVRRELNFIRAPYVKRWNPPGKGQRFLRDPVFNSYTVLNVPVYKGDSATRVFLSQFSWLPLSMPHN